MKEVIRMIDTRIGKNKRNQKAKTKNVKLFMEVVEYLFGQKNSMNTKNFRILPLKQIGDNKRVKQGYVSYDFVRGYEFYVTGKPGSFEFNTLVIGLLKKLLANNLDQKERLYEEMNHWEHLMMINLIEEVDNYDVQSNEYALTRIYFEPISKSDNLYGMNIMNFA